MGDRMVSLNLRLLQLLKLFYNTIFTRINTYEIEIKIGKNYENDCYFSGAFSLVFTFFL